MKTLCMYTCLIVMNVSQSTDTTDGLCRDGELMCNVTCSHGVCVLLSLRSGPGFLTILCLFEV